MALVLNVDELSPVGKAEVRAYGYCPYLTAEREREAFSIPRPGYSWETLEAAENQRRR